LNAALAWYGLLKTAKDDTVPIGQRIADFWGDLIASHPLEAWIDQPTTGLLRGVSAGIFPQFEISPSDFWVQWVQFNLSKILPRERFTNFKGLLEDHIRFGEIESLLDADSPILLIGAANVLKGKLKIFNSKNGEIQAESILASAAIPTLFPAVRIGEDYYWDGLFSANPPVDELIQPRIMGKGNIPDEIWIILINSVTCKSVPTQPSEIVDRRNQMIGNVSLLQDLQTLGLLERAFQKKLFSGEILAEYGYCPEWVKIRFVRMSEGVQASLDYPSKLSRSREHIHKLMADGEKQALAFIQALDKPALTVEEAGRLLTETAA
jgi:NTE family protein